jgi:hypothetical protein
MVITKEAEDIIRNLSELGFHLQHSYTVDKRGDPLIVTEIRLTEEAHIVGIAADSDLSTSIVGALHCMREHLRKATEVIE